METQTSLEMYPATTGIIRVSESEKWTLPGHGEAYHTCGEIRAKAWCGDCETYKHDLLHYCYRAECPTCRKAWLGRETRRATDRIFDGFYMLREIERGAQLHHVVWSVPVSEYDRPFDELRRRFHYRRRVAGSKAGLVIFHPFRFRNAITGVAVAWKHCSLNPDAEAPVVDCIKSYEPHFHSLSVGFLMRSDAFAERFGWIYKKLHHESPIWKKSDMRGVIWYQLSHAGIRGGNHALSWYGKFSRNQMVVVKTDYEYLTMKCDDCGCILWLHHQKTRTIDGHPVDGYREQWTIHITKKHYKFKGAG